MALPFLPYGKQTITTEDKQAVMEALESPFLTTGPRIGEFESTFAEYVGSSHAVAFANATAALHIACMALDVKSGDVVLTPTMSFAASTNCAAYLGADIEFMDCDPDTGLVTPKTFAAAADKAEAKGISAKVAVVVHLNGESADMVGIEREAKSRGIRLIEDACHALGTTYEDEAGVKRNVGACEHSDISTFSFHPVKTITSGEGGMLTCNDAGLAGIVSDLRSHGVVRDPERLQFSELAADENGTANPWYYEMQSLGFNYRLTDVASALGLSQLKRMDEIASARRHMKEVYDQLFSDSNLPVRPVRTAAGVDPVRHLYPVLVDYEAVGISRAAFVGKLRDAGIGSQVHYIPTHMQPYYVEKYGKQSLPGAENYYSKVLSLPFYPGLTDNDLTRVFDTVRNALGV